MRFANIVLAFFILSTSGLNAMDLERKHDRDSRISHNLGLKLGPLSGEAGLAVGWQLDPRTLIELVYTRDGNYQRADSDDSQSEAFTVLYRRYFGRSIYLSAGVGVNEYRAVLKNADLQDVEMNVMNRDLNLRFGIGNRWKLDELWFFGVEWMAFDKSLAQLDRESSVHALTGTNQRAQAEAFALSSLRKASFASTSFLNVEFGMNL